MSLIIGALLSVIQANLDLLLLKLLNHKGEERAVHLDLVAIYWYRTLRLELLYYSS